MSGSSVALTIFKELQAINRKSIFDDTAVITPDDEDNPVSLKISLTPQLGPYEGGFFVFKMTIPPNYPCQPPRVTCSTKIYHPNISYPQGNICFNMLSESNTGYRIEHYVNGLLYLLHYPNLESRLNSKVTSNQAEFLENVKRTLQGQSIAGMRFQFNLGRELTSEEKMVLLCSEIGLGHKTLADLFGESSQLTHEQLVSLTKMTPSPEHTAATFQKIFPFLLPASEAGISYTLHRLKRTTASVATRCALLGCPEEQALKEMLVTVGGKPCLVLTNGRRIIDQALLSAILDGQEVEVPKASEARSHLNFAVSRLCFMGVPAHFPVFVNERVLDQGSVFTFSGFPCAMMQIAPRDLLTLIPRARVLPDFTSPPKPPPSLPPPSPVPTAPSEQLQDTATPPLPSLPLHPPPSPASPPLSPASLPLEGLEGPSLPVLQLSNSLDALVIA